MAYNIAYIWGASLVALVIKNLPANIGDIKRHGFDPWVGKIPWSRAWQPTPVFLSWKSRGQWSLGGYRPWGHKRVRHDLATKQQQKSHQSKPEAEEYSSGHLWTLLVTFRVELETF